MRLTQVLLLGLCVVFAALAINHSRQFFHGENNIPVDFAAFYCGGKAALDGADPYLLEPITSCERRVSDNGRLLIFKPFPPYGTPVPLPPYDFAPLAALAILPFGLAKAVFGLLELAAMFGAAYALWRLSPLPFAVALGVAFFGIVFESLIIGQLPPFAIAALGLAAVAFRRGNTVAGALAVCVSLVQPQFGAPAVLAALIFYPRARIPIALFAAIIVAGGLPFGGLSRMLEYARVLPLHARAEIAFAPQYSASFLAHQLGVETSLALTIGSLSYLVMVALGIGVAIRARRAAIAGGAAILLPPAFSVLGGSFIHLHQIAVALLVAFSVKYSKLTALPAAIGISLLIFPWNSLAGKPLSHGFVLSVAIAFLVSGGAIVFLLKDAVGLRTSFAAAAIGVAAAIVTFGFLHATGPASKAGAVTAAIRVPAPALAPGTLGSVAWGEAIAITNAEDPPAGSIPYKWTHSFIKYPTWLALFLVLASVSYELLSDRSDSEREPASIDEHRAYGQAAAGLAT